MEKDPNCMCADCFTQRMVEILDEPLPNPVGLETEKMNFLNYNSKADHRNKSTDEAWTKMIEYIKKIDVYGEKQDIRELLNFVALYTDVDSKRINDEIAKTTVLKGLPQVTKTNRQKRIYENQKTLKTIFEPNEDFNKNEL